MAAPITPAELAQWQAMFGTGAQSAPAPIANMGPPPPPLPPPVSVAAAPVQRGAMTPLSDFGLGGGTVAKKNTSGLDLGLNLNAAPMPVMPKGAEPWVEPPKETFAKPAADAAAGAQLGGASQPMQLQAPAPAKPTYVPGGWSPSSRSGRLNLTGDEKGTLASADENRQQGTELQTAVAADTADKVAGQLVGQQVGLERAETERINREADRMAAGQQATAKLQDLTKEVNDASNIDPGKFWDNKGTLAKVVGALGVALGGFAASRTGGPNEALATIERAIDRDVDAQKARLAAARGKMSEQRGILGAMREQFGDERMAEAAAKHAMLDNAERRVHALIAGNASQDIQARGQQMIADIQERKYGHQEHLERLAQGNVTERYTPGGFVGGGAPKGSASDPKLFVPTGANGEGYAARTEKEAIQGRAARAAASALEDAINKGIELRGKTSGVERWAGTTKIPFTDKALYESEDVAGLKSAVARAKAAAKNAEELGAWDNGSSELTGQLVGDLASSGGSPETAARDYLSSKKKQLANFERAQGAQGVQQSIAMDTQGRPVAVTNGQSSFAAPRTDMPASFRPVDGRAPAEGYNSPQKSREWNGEVVAPKSKGGKKASKGPLSAEERARYEEIVRTYPKDGE